MNQDECRLQIFLGGLVIDWFNLPMHCCCSVFILWRLIELTTLELRMFAKQMFVFVAKREIYLGNSPPPIFDVNVLRISENLFESLQKKTNSGHSCGITTWLVKSDERNKLETHEEVKCDKNLCLNCNKICPFQNFKSSKSKIEKVSKAIMKTVKYLLKDLFIVGWTNNPTLDWNQFNYQTEGNECGT